MLERWAWTRGSIALIIAAGGGSVKTVPVAAPLGHPLVARCPQRRFHFFFQNHLFPEPRNSQIRHAQIQLVASPRDEGFPEQAWPTRVRSGALQTNGAL
jgi:hypothetical protein